MERGAFFEIKRFTNNFNSNTNEWYSMIIKAFYLFLFFYSVMDTPFCLKMLYNIYYMTSRVSIQEYFPSVTGKPLSVMSFDAKWNFDFTDIFWTFWKLNCHALYFKLFIHVSIKCLYFVNTAASCQLYTSTRFIQICFQNIIFEKEVCASWFSAQMYVFMLKNTQFPIR
jgi:hypothetical protein